MNTKRLQCVTPSFDGFEELFNAAPDAMILANDRGEIILANNQVSILFGHKKEELYGQHIDVLLPKRFQKRHHKTFTHYFDDPKPRLMGSGIELFGLRSDGSEFDVDISLSPIKSNGEIYVVAAMRDISDRKRLERKSVEANMKLKTFTSSVAHDLQNPLATIVGFCDLLEDSVRKKLKEPEQVFFTTIKNSAENMSELVSDLLAYSRSNDQSTVVFEKSDLNKIVMTAFSHLASEIKNRNVKITYDYLPTVRCNSGMITQLFQNLIGNAIKYNSSDEPQIHIGCLEESSQWMFSVRDNGVGIDPKYYSQVFEPFKRGPITDDGNGSGLGLSICKRVAELHKGKIRVESKLGEGSTFWFSISKELKNV